MIKISDFVFKFDLREFFVIEMLIYLRNESNCKGKFGGSKLIEEQTRENMYCFKFLCEKEDYSNNKHFFKKKIGMFISQL